MTILEVEDADVRLGLGDEDETKVQEYLAMLQERKKAYLDFYKKAQDPFPLFSDYKRLLNRPLEGELRTFGYELRSFGCNSSQS